MISDLQIVKIRDHLEFLKDGHHIIPERVLEGIPLLSAKDISYGINVNKSSATFISKEDFVNFHKNWEIKTGDVLVTVVGTIGRTAIVQDKDHPFTLQRSVGILRPDNSFTSEFLFYWLNSIEGQWQLNSRDTGSVQACVFLRDLGDLRIPLFQLKQQHFITELLQPIDKMIQSLKNESTIIEELTSALFKSWFIDFDPVKARAEGGQPFGMDKETVALFPDSFVDSSLGPIPAGWKIGKMKDVTKVIGGGTPSTKNPDYWGGDICWTSPKDLSKIQGLILLDTVKKITEKGLSKVSSGLLPSNTVLMSSRAPIGYLALTRIPMAINQGYIAFGQNKIFGPSYLLNWCKFNLLLIEAYAGGSTFPEISKSNFKEIRCIIPRVEILEKFETLCKPLFDQLGVNARTIKSLEDTRGSLLPRLMSGELSVESLED